MSVKKRSKTEPLNFCDTMTKKLGEMDRVNADMEARVKHAARFYQMLRSDSAVGENNVAKLIVEQFHEFGGQFDCDITRGWTDQAIIVFAECLSGGHGERGPFLEWFLALADGVLTHGKRGHRMPLWGEECEWDMFVLLMRHFTVTTEIIDAGKKIVAELEYTATKDDSSDDEVKQWLSLILAFFAALAKDPFIKANPATSIE